MAIFWNCQPVPSEETRTCSCAGRYIDDVTQSDSCALGCGASQRACAGNRGPIDARQAKRSPGVVWCLTGIDRGAAQAAPAGGHSSHLNAGAAHRVPLLRPCSRCWRVKGGCRYIVDPYRRW